MIVALYLSSYTEKKIHRNFIYMKLSKSTLNKAVESEIISNKQAEKLWHFIEENDNQQSKFTLVNLFFCFVSIIH